MSKLKNITKIISLFLAILMIIEIFPLNAIAASIKTLSGSFDDYDIEKEYSDTINIVYGTHSVDIGRAGTLTIDDYTLRPTLEFSSLGISGNILPVNISMEYNSSGYRYLKNIMDYTITAYGSGFAVNYNKAVYELKFNDKTQIAYVIGGQTILFEQTEFNENDEEMPDGTTKWQPVDSSYNCCIYKLSDEYSLTEDAVSNGVQMQYAMFENDYVVQFFDTQGRLREYIEYEYDTSIRIDYVENGPPEAISKITDGVGNEYRFTYTDNLLSKIKCYTSDRTAIVAGDGENAKPLEMNFAYTNGKLTTVTYPDGKTTAYAYNIYGDISEITDIDGYRVTIAYLDGSVSKISEFALDEDGRYVSGDWLDISWGNNTRTFTDNNGDEIIKTFDDNGKILSVVDGDGNYIYQSTDYIPEEDITFEDFTIEDITEELFVSLCPCLKCTEYNCICECESEDVCTCIQCKRGYNTVEDESGNILLEESFDGIKTMKSQNLYTENGNHLAQTIDTSGNVVYYVYDEAGMLDLMTSGDMQVNFDYDAMGNLTKLYQQVSGLLNGSVMTNEYTYTDDKITSITHNGFSYNFTYDEWGNQQKLKSAIPHFPLLNIRQMMF